MGVEGTKATGYGNHNAKPPRRPPSEVLAGFLPGFEEVGAALEVAALEATKRFEEAPEVPPCKFSLALMKGGDWCASLNCWTTRRGVSSFSGTPGGAVVGLGTKLLSGEPWKALPKRD